jgi:hypothetical protein
LDPLRVYEFSSASHDIHLPRFVSAFATLSICGIPRYAVNPQEAWVFSLGELGSGSMAKGLAGPASGPTSPRQSIDNKTLDLDK